MPRVKWRWRKIPPGAKKRWRTSDKCTPSIVFAKTGSRPRQQTTRVNAIASSATSMAVEFQGDFRSARSEIQSEVRRPIAERDAEQLPGCGF